MYSSSWTTLVLAPAALAFVGGMAVGQEKAPTYTIDDPKSKHAVVARIGPWKITAEEFRLSYEFGPAFARRSNDAKHHYLGYMINEKLLALDASTREHEILPLVAPALSEIEGDLATEELYKDDVQSKVKVSGAEIAAGIEQSKRQMTLQWIFAPRQLEIERWAGMLRLGASFDSLYRLQGPDSLLASNRTLEATLFNIRTRNPEIASVADTLKPGYPSVAIKGTDGWYILRLAYGSRDAVTTQSEETKLHEDVHRALLQQKSDSVSKLYVNALMTKHHPVIVPQTLDLLSSYLALKFLDSADAHAWGMVSAVGGRNDPSLFEDIDKQGRRPLVTLSGGVKIPLQQFLTWYRNRETLIKLVTSSKQAYLFSLEQMIWQMVRDHILVERAMKRNLQARETVRTQKRWWKEKLLYEAEKRSMADSISFDDNLLQAFFEANSRRYKNAQGAPMSYLVAREDVLRDYYEFELTKRILHRINALKMKYQVNIDESVLGRIPVEGDSRGINLYAVKKGGIFPRPAFPTIDMMWQTWN